MHRHTFYIHSFGCKSNIYEADAVAQYLRQQDWREVECLAEADLIIYNTCTVTAEAGRKARQALRRTRRENPQAKLLVMGCYSQMVDLHELADYSGGTQERLALVQKALQDIEQNQKEGQAHFPPIFPAPASSYEELGPVTRQKETRAQLKIADGCNQRCSYCAICLSRGPLRSRRREEILAEARALVSLGHRELVLTATNLTAFERDSTANPLALAELLQELAELEDLQRIRLGSLEPQHLESANIEALGRIAKLCPHFHMSLQSGSDKILRKMARGYTVSEYLRIVRDLKTNFPQVSITTDIMVGFPGETESDFQASLDLARRVGFARIHVFRYSPRPHTPAASWPQVDPLVKKERSERMLALASELALAKAKSFLKQEVEIILETQKTPESTVYSGYTAHYLPAEMELGDLAQSAESGQLWRGRVEKIMGEKLRVRAEERLV